MNILITGSNGFVGGYIAELLFKKGYFVYGVGTKECSTSQYVTGYYKWDLGHEDMPDSVKNLKIDCIIHVASLKDFNDDNIELMYSNCIGTYRIYELSKYIGVNNIILLSSIPVIGLHCNNIIKENTNLKPESMYHASKAMQEFILNQLNKIGIGVCSLRIPSPIGPGQPENTIVPIFVRRAMDNKNIMLSGRGTRKQNYVDVRDIAECILFLLENKDAQGTYNIGAQSTISNYELARLCIEVACSESQILFTGDVDLSDNDNWLIDSSKLASLGYSLKYRIKDTLNDMVRFNKKLCR